MAVMSLYTQGSCSLKQNSPRIDFCCQLLCFPAFKGNSFEAALVSLKLLKKAQVAVLDYSAECSRMILIFSSYTNRAGVVLQGHRVPLSEIRQTQSCVLACVIGFW